MSIGIRVKDDGAYRKIALKLGELGISCVNLDRTPCADIAVDLTDPAVSGVDWAVKECVRAVYGKFVEIVVGVDPGPRPGVAVFGDGRFVCGSNPASPERAVAFVREVLYFCECDSCVIRVGDGAGVYRNRIINGLLPLRIELVDEKKTSRNGDIEAAKQIAFLKGSPVKGPIELEPGEGEIREIQNESRSMSGVTISKDLAREVAEGSIDMEAAIKKQKEKK